MSLRLCFIKKVVLPHAAATEAVTAAAAAEAVTAAAAAAAA